MRLKGKIALVTGSSRGIGCAISLAFAREGANVVITYNQSRDQGDQVVSKICKKGGEAFSHYLDVTDRESVKAVIAQTVERFGRVDILVNNAGVNKVNDFDRQTLEEWNDVLAVDLTGPFLCSQEVLPYLSSGGRVINIGSTSGQIGGPRTPAYAAAKAGLLALTHCMARFVAHRKITVNCLSPGIIASELTEKTMAPSVKETRLRNILLGRLGRYEEVAEAAVFLASDEASFITAETLNVNGGEWW